MGKNDIKDHRKSKIQPLKEGVNPKMSGSNQRANLRRPHILKGKVPERRRPGGANAEKKNEFRQSKKNLQTEIYGLN